MSTVVDKFNTGLLEKVQIRKASEVIENIISKHSEKVFIKMDCEGSEKEIIPELDEAGTLSKITLINMEWHFEYPQHLIDILKKNHFIVTCYRKNNNELGTLIAFKR